MEYSRHVYLLQNLQSDCTLLIRRI